MDDDGHQFHFDPSTYRDMVIAEIPAYEELQDRTAGATAGIHAQRILDLGVGTGETSVRVVEKHPTARLWGIDESPGMLAYARRRLPGARLLVGRLEDPLPLGPFDLIVTALAVHHLDGPGKATLFARVAGALRPGGRFVLGDVIVPADAAAAAIPLTDDWDKPSTVAEQVGWLEDAGLAVTVLWQEDDLAIFSAERPPH